VSVGEEPGIVICLEDDSNGNILQLNTRTGDYLFRQCATGFTLAGKGAITICGCTITLQDPVADHNVIASIDTCQRRGQASVRSASRVTGFTIFDANTANDSCLCP
jgi:hypothetical protein